jgi:plastocyanin
MSNSWQRVTTYARPVTGLPLVLALAVMTLACGEELPSALAQTTAVGVIDNRFDPTGNRVEPGQTVTWTWSGSNQHNVTFDDAALTNSPTQMQGTFERAFADEGEFTYYCTIHGRDVMSGRVVVGTVASNGTPTGGGY